MGRVKTERSIGISSRVCLSNEAKKIIYGIRRLKDLVVCMSFTNRRDEVEMKDLMACLFEERCLL